MQKHLFGAAFAVAFSLAAGAASAQEKIVISNWDAYMPPDLLANPGCWPERVIVMTLDRVGSHGGPDLDRLRAVKSAARKVYAAGGVRDAADLHALAEAGIAGALIASSLHNGRLTAADLQKIA